MGNVSTSEFDKYCDSNLIIENINYCIDFYIDKRWFIIKLTKNYKLDVSEIIESKLLDIKKFNIDYSQEKNLLKLYYEKKNTNYTIYENIDIESISELRRTSIDNIHEQYENIMKMIEKKLLPNSEDISKYANVLKFFCTCIIE